MENAAALRNSTFLLCLHLPHHLSLVKAYETDMGMSKQGYYIIMLEVSAAFPAASLTSPHFSADSLGKRLGLSQRCRKVKETAQGPTESKGGSRLKP